MSLSKMSATSNRNLFNNCDINVEQIKTEEDVARVVESVNGGKMIDCGDIDARFHNYVVFVSNENWAQEVAVVHRWNDFQTNHIFQKVLSKLLQYSSEEIDKEEQANSDKYKEWCGLVIIHACITDVLLEIE
jgi:hypothetical protein